MSFYLEMNPQNPWDKWAPTSKISFEALKKIFPSIEKGDLVLEQKAAHSHRFWAFYKPDIEKNYDFYTLGFSGDSSSIFYHEKKINSPIIIKSDDKNLITLLKKQLSQL